MNVFLKKGDIHVQNEGHQNALYIVSILRELNIHIKNQLYMYWTVPQWGNRKKKWEWCNKHVSLINESSQVSFNLEFFFG